MNVTTSSRTKFDRSILTPSRSYGYFQVLMNVSVFGILLVLAAFSDSLWQFVLLVFAIGCSQHRLFFPIHDCIHFSLFPNKNENRFFGSICSAMIGTSFEAIKTQHMAHHRDFGHEHDPGASDYFVRFYSRWELASFLLGPLVGSILYKKVFDYISRPALLASDPKAGAKNQGYSVNRIAPYLVIFLVQTVICAILTQNFQPAEFWRYPVFYILPLITVFLFFNRLRMFLEHGSLDYEVCDYLEDKRPTARTIYASWLERLVICGGGFNFHHEHHKYPNVPGWRLPEVHQKILHELDSEDIRETYMTAVFEIWKNLPWSATKIHDSIHS